MARELAPGGALAGGRAQPAIRDTAVVLECDGEPKQDNEGKRAQKPREGKY